MEKSTRGSWIWTDGSIAWGCYPNPRFAFILVAKLMHMAEYYTILALWGKHSRTAPRRTRRWTPCPVLVEKLAELDPTSGARRYGVLRALPDPEKHRPLPSHCDICGSQENDANLC